MAELLSQQLPSCRLNENSVVMDLGANRGRFSRMAARKGATVLAFEPSPFAARVAEKTLKGFKNARVFRAAVSNKSGIIDLYQHAKYESDRLGHSISASLYSTKPNIDSAISLPVLTVSFSEILDNVEMIYLLKVDIEGSELLIWPALRLNYQKIQFLIMELHTFSPSHQKLAEEISTFIKVNQLTNNWSIYWP